MYILPVYLLRIVTMRITTRSFKSGNSIAVRIPAAFNVEPGMTFEIQQRGGELVLMPHEKNLASVINILREMPADFFADGRDDAPPQERHFASDVGVPYSAVRARPKNKKSAAKITKRRKSV
jgi:antitoxin VapB